MLLPTLLDQLLKGWVFQGRTNQNQFVLLGPHTQAGQITYQVRVGRKIIYEGAASNASRIFLQKCKQEPTPLACVTVTSIPNYNQYMN